MKDKYFKLEHVYDLHIVSKTDCCGTYRLILKRLPQIYEYFYYCGYCYSLETQTEQLRITIKRC